MFQICKKCLFLFSPTSTRLFRLSSFFFLFPSALCMNEQIIVWSVQGSAALAGDNWKGTGGIFFPLQPNILHWTNIFLSLFSCQRSGEVVRGKTTKPFTASQAIELKKSMIVSKPWFLSQWSVGASSCSCRTHAQRLAVNVNMGAGLGGDRLQNEGGGGGRGCVLLLGGGGGEVGDPPHFWSRYNILESRHQSRKTTKQVILHSSCWQWQKYLCTVSWAWAWLASCIQAVLNWKSVQVEFYRTFAEGSLGAELESLEICLQSISCMFVR